MKYYFYSIILFLAVGCKEDVKFGLNSSSSERNTTVLPVEEQWLISNQKGMSDSLIQSYRLSAEGILEHRIKEGKANMISALEKDLWHVEAILKGSDMTFGENLKGAWVDFYDNNKYKYGNYGITVGGGKYHYDVDKSLILMLDDDNRIKPQEFQPILNNDGLVFVGSQIYRDNNMQVKFERKTVLPVKPAPAKLE